MTIAYNKLSIKKLKEILNEYNCAVPSGAKKADLVELVEAIMAKDEEFVTINEVSEICSNITGSNLKPIYKKDRPREVKHATCSAEKARNLLNYKTTVDLKTGISKTYDYIKKRGTKPFEYYINLEINNELTPEVWKKREL